jgi:DNA-binding response OmpR family regulator
LIYLDTEAETTASTCCRGKITTLELAEALTNPALDPIIWKKRILLVDDFPAVLDVLRLSLSRKGAVVDAHPTLTSARAQLERATFDLVLSDISLPDGDGFELYTDLERRAENSASPSGVVPLILTTGFGYDQTHAIVNVAESMKKRGAGDLTVLYKPFKDDELTASIHRTLATFALRTSAA